MSKKRLTPLSVGFRLKPALLETSCGLCRHRVALSGGAGVNSLRGIGQRPSLGELFQQNF